MATEITVGEIGRIAAYVSDLGAARRFHGEQRELRRLVHRAPGTALWLADFDAPDGGTHALMEERVTPAT